MDSTNWQPLIVALGLGLLVGLQREWAKSEKAGIRTFALITVLGTVCGLLGATLGGWVVAAGLLGLSALLAVMNMQRSSAAKAHPGQTTEVAALLMFATGALLAVGQTPIAVTLGGTVAVLLQWKKPLHRWVDRIVEAEIRAVFQVRPDRNGRAPAASQPHIRAVRRTQPLPDLADSRPHRRD